jgi:hypothetical protein
MWDVRITTRVAITTETQSALRREKSTRASVSSAPLWCACLTKSRCNVRSTMLSDAISTWHSPAVSSERSGVDDAS